MPLKWPMVGRDRAVTDVIAMLGDGDIRGIALTGQAGVGKTRIAREVALRAADAGWSTRTITATATSRRIPLGACAQWTDDVDGVPAAVVRRVSEAVLDGAPAGRLLLFVDDAHLLDDLSALVVQRLVQTRAGKVIVTMRTGEPIPDAVSALWKDDLVVWREVDPLTSDEVAEVLHSTFGARPDQRVMERFWGLTQGNMLFARQLADQEAAAGRLRAVDGVLRWEGAVTVRGSLADLVETQVGALRDSVLDVIDVVVVAEPVDVRCLALLAEQRAIEDAEQRGLIRVVDQQVFIGHPLFADIRRGRCGTTRLRRLRGEVAVAMGDAGTRAEFVKRGLLWSESDLPPNPELLLSAADSANSLLAFDVAERLFAAAAGDTRAGAAVHVSRALSLFMMSEGHLTNEALARAPIAGDSGSGFVNDVVMRASNALWTMRAPTEATRIVDEALEAETGERRQQLLVFRAIQFALAGCTSEVVETLAAIDHRVLDPHGTVMLGIATCMAYGELGRPQQMSAAAAQSMRALEIAGQATHLRGAR